MSEHGRIRAGGRDGEDPPPVRRLLVALDPVRIRTAPIEAAARLARSLGLELVGLVLQEPTLRRIAAFPFTQELRLGSGQWHGFEPDDVEAALRAHVRHAERLVADVCRRFGLGGSVQVAQGLFPSQAFEFAGARDLVFVDRSSAHALADRGYRQVVALFDGGEAAGRALRSAVELARATASGLRVLLIGDDRAALEQRRSAAYRIMADLMPAGRQSAAFGTIGVGASLDAARLRAALDDGGSTLLLLPVAGAAAPSELGALCGAVGCSMIVLRSFPESVPESVPEPPAGSRQASS